MGQEAKTDATEARPLARMGAALDLRPVELLPVRRLQSGHRALPDELGLVLR